MKKTKEEYAGKLRDPRWQKKRLQILERDRWACQLCLSTKSMLVIHHTAYTVEDPWDEGDDHLITLCHDCHQDQHEGKYDTDRLLSDFLRAAGLFNDDIHALAESFSEIWRPLNKPERTALIDAITEEIRKVRPPEEFDEMARGVVSNG